MAQMPVEQVVLALASECAVAQSAFDAFVAQAGDLGDEIHGLSLPRTRWSARRRAQPWWTRAR